MVFRLKADKSVIINGKIVTFEAGDIKTTDEAEVSALKKCRGVTEVKAKRK